MRPRLKMRLGDLLVQDGIITESQLQQALADQKQNGRKLGVTLIDLGFISEHDLLEFLARQLNIPLLDLSDKRIPENVVNLVPEVQARRHRALVVEADESSALVAMSDPADLAAVDAISQFLQPREMRLAVVPDSELLGAFDNLYRRTKDIAQFAKELQTETQDGGEFDLGALSLDADDDDATVAKLLQSIFADAVQVRASDIHIEPDDRALRIRMRVDGALQENVLTETNIANALLLRLKLMSGLDISEKRLPQDGRFNIKVRDHSIDVRVSTMPVQYGESCVMRLLDQSAGLLNLEQTGMPEDILARVRRLVHRPYGMFVVTGPTGSGKTTTLYGALSELNQAEKKIITVEDPVEYRLPRISQVQVNAKIGLSFSNVLRTTLRQDPDIIMVGEMRDHETVEIGLRGAITGHLVLTTLHTNDSITSALRLIDMGAKPYLVGAALRGVLAQRLIRRVCESCKTTATVEPHQLAILRIMNPDIAADGSGFVKGKGCRNCNHTGYKGRIGVFELLEIDEAMIDALRDGDMREFAHAAKASPGFKPLANVALDYAMQGITSIDEVLFLAETVEEKELRVSTAAVSDQVEPEVGSDHGEL
ncbi:MULTISPECIES: GspE/PulE family protein [Idiomarina]|uniref:GspE/PulE family protein n=1 Tax=Idiomarina TaxID=135575 RepID=UPI00129C56E3|nr:MULTISPECIES: GspE/PulE family protein [Idiomarina]MRJ42040.1 MSHA biogenesis protein MshE [Idiomarina sp. FeN1]NCU57323.1 MSHA biogenesis protein MshE [Idiomarina sp. FenA--70]NCU60031.1 MSHA biogenesis protein MshE [Idiomarina sp. FenBw--71]UUN12938.1 Flp pilus assembly complex ATPase component TadA [Idiomarina loihiensis]